MSILAVLASEAAGFESPNKWLPATDEIIFGGIAFLVVFGALVKFAGPPIKKGLAGRTARIQADLDKSAAAKSAAEAEAARVKADLAGADQQAAAIVADAKMAAQQLRIDLRARLATELVETRARAIADIDAARTRGNAELEGEVARLAVGAAERVVERNLDDATQQALIESFIAEVGGMRS